MSPDQSAKILIVEDEAIVAMDLDLTLRDAGYDVLGPLHSLAAVTALLENQTPTAALLDVNLSDGTVFPAADTLAARAVPFVFLTGHLDRALPERHRNRPTLSKPYNIAMLLELLSELLREAPPESR